MTNYADESPPHALRLRPPLLSRTVDQRITAEVINALVGSALRAEEQICWSGKVRAMVATITAA